MLTKEEIRLFIDQDTASFQKRQARQGERYYEADHDIRKCRMFFYNADGQLVEDHQRANVKIPHPFFTELVDQATQYILSGDDPFVCTDDTDLQKELDSRFNNNDDFRAELGALLNDCQEKGIAYMYAMKDASDKLRFVCADSIGVVEVEARFADDGKDHVIYWYIDRIDKDGHKIKKIQDWDDSQTYYYVQDEDDEILDDPDAVMSPRPHVLYRDDQGQMWGRSFGYVPFFRLDNNKKQWSSLKPIKDLIDDYDLMASSLSNNLIDFDHPLYVVKGFQGQSLDELQQNLKTKKMIGTSPDGGVEIHTVDVPYEARKAKMELDEKNIYRFGFGLNLSGLKDTSATTNIAIKAAYSLLDLRCNRLETQLKRFLRRIVNVVVDEINEQQKTDYQSDSVWFDFHHEVMSNEQENAQIELTDAQKKQTEVNTLMSLSQILGDEQTVRMICDVLDIDYNDIKDQIPKQDPYADLEKQLGGDSGGDEPTPEGSATGSAEA